MLVAGGKILIRSVLGMLLVCRPCVPAPGPPKTWTTRQPMVSVRLMIFSLVRLSTYPTPRARSGEPSNSMAASRTWTLAGGRGPVLCPDHVPVGGGQDRFLRPGVLEHGRLHRCPGRDGELLIDRELGRLPLDHRFDKRCNRVLPALHPPVVAILAHVPDGVISDHTGWPRVHGSGLGAVLDAALVGDVRSDDRRGQDLVDPVGEGVLAGDLDFRAGPAAEDALLVVHGPRG